MRKRPTAGIGEGTDEVRTVQPGEKTESAIERARRILSELEAKRARERNPTVETASKRDAGVSDSETARVHADTTK